VALLVLPTVATAEKPAPPITMVAEQGQYDVRSGAYHAVDNVRITRGDLIIHADEARSFSNAEGQVERVELYGSPTRWSDVLEDGSAVEGHSDEIIHDFTRNIITMLGNAHIRNFQGEFSGSKLVYDLDSQNLVGDGGVRLVIEPASGARPQREEQPDNDPGTD
jgi:lipopolysaccharide export system protein LptA